MKLKSFCLSLCVRTCIYIQVVNTPNSINSLYVFVLSKKNCNQPSVLISAEITVYFYHSGYIEWHCTFFQLTLVTIYKIPLLPCIFLYYTIYMCVICLLLFVYLQNPSWESVQFTASTFGKHSSLSGMSKPFLCPYQFGL